MWLWPAPTHQLLTINWGCCRTLQEGAGGEHWGHLLYHGRGVVRHLQVLQVQWQQRQPPGLLEEILTFRERKLDLSAKLKIPTQTTVHCRTESPTPSSMYEENLMRNTGRVLFIFDLFYFPSKLFSSSFERIFLKDFWQFSTTFVSSLARSTNYLILHCLLTIWSMIDNVIDHKWYTIHMINDLLCSTMTRLFNNKSPSLFWQ